MSETINIVIVDKKFETQALQGLVIRSEGNANTIKIQFPKTYESEDLTTKMFILKCTNANGIYFETLLQKNVKTDYIELTWVVEPVFTTVSGILKVAIFAESANYSLGTTMSKVIVEESPQIMVPIDQYTVFEQYLKEMRVAADEVERDRAEALDSKNVAVAAKDEAVAAKDLAVPASVTAVDAKNIAVVARDEAVAARDIAVTAADDAVVRMAAYESGAIAVQVETNKNDISVIKNYLNSSRYGVVFSGSNPQGTRVEDAVGMVANVAVDDQIVVNDFDSIPFFNRRICCGTHDVNGNFIVNAYRDEPGFAWDGTNGEVYYEETPFYWAGDLHNYVSVSAVPLDGYTLSPRFRNGTDKEYSPVFWEAIVAGKPTSRAGVFADYGSLNSHMASAKLYHARAHTETMAARMSDYILQLVEFATKDLQTVMMGAANMPYSDSYKALEAGTGVNRIVIDDTLANDFLVGQTVSIGTSAGADTIAKNRIIISIETVAVGKKAINFDGAAVNIAIGNVISSRPWKNGATNIVGASSGSPGSNTDGKRPCIWRGKVDPWATAFSAICDVLFIREGEEGAYEYYPHYLEDPTKYAAGALTDDYTKLSYKVGDTTGYAKTLGIDKRFPHVRLTDEVGASSTTYLAAYYYAPNGDIRVPFVGGLLAGGRDCSPVYFACADAPSASYWYRLSRLFVSRV